MEPEESSTLCETPFLVSSSAEREERKKNEAFLGSRSLCDVCCREGGGRGVALTQLPDEGHKFLVLAQRQDGALVRSYGCWEAEELREGRTRSLDRARTQDLNTSALTEFTDRSLLVAFSDVECVLEDGVHDPADAEGRLDDVGNNLLHCGLQIREKNNKKN